MKIEKIEIWILKIPFKIKFNHFLKSRDFTENVVLKLSSEKFTGVGESVPREYVTGENVNRVYNTLNQKFLLDLKKKEFKRIDDVINYLAIYSKNLKKDELSAFGCYSDALLNLAAQEFNFSIDDLFNYLKVEMIEKSQIKYSAVIGESGIFSTLIKSLTIKIRGFENVKVKISPVSLKHLNLIRFVLSKQKIYVDANCSFNLENIESLITVLKKNNVKLVEQPFLIDDIDREKIYSRLKQENISVMLDESFCMEKDLVKLFKEGDVVNLRINKVGGIISTLRLYKRLSEMRVRVVLGCMVGESILTRENLILSSRLNTIFNEGNYDSFLFKKSLVDNPSFEKNGIFNFDKFEFDLNEQIDLKRESDVIIIRK